MSWIRDIAIGLAVMIAAVLAFLLAIQLAGIGLFEFGQQIRYQGNRWLLPVRLGVYIWTVWFWPRKAGFTGRQLGKLRMTLAGFAVFIELVIVQRLFLF